MSFKNWSDEEPDAVKGVEGLRQGPGRDPPRKRADEARRRARWARGVETGKDRKTALDALLRRCYEETAKTRRRTTSAEEESLPAIVTEEELQQLREKVAAENEEEQGSPISSHGLNHKYNV